MSKNLCDSEDLHIIPLISSLKMNSSGMQAFSKKFQPDKVLLVGDSGLPWQEFLKINPDEIFDR